MLGRYHSDERRTRLIPRGGTGARLPLWLSVLVIAALSALAWAILIFAVMGLWAAL